MAKGAERKCLFAVSIEKFQANLASYGPDLSLWPDQERRAAETLLAGSEEARQLLELEALLKTELGDNKIAAPKGLTDRIIDKALSSDPNKPKR